MLGWCKLACSANLHHSINIKNTKRHSVVSLSNLLIFTARLEGVYKYEWVSCTHVRPFKWPPSVDQPTR